MFNKIVLIVIAIAVVGIGAMMLMDHAEASRRQVAVSRQLDEAAKRKALVDKTSTDIAEIKMKLEDFNITHGTYPTTGQGLDILGTVPKDPWGNDYIYRCPGQVHTDTCDVLSMGPDGHEGTDDDIDH